MSNSVRLSLFFFVVSIMLLFYCSCTTIVVFSTENILGLAEKLDAYYWLGLTLVMSSLFLLILNREKPNLYEKLFILEICLLALYLFAIPDLVEENVHFYDSWQHSSGSMAILTYEDYVQPLSLYAREYPGAFMFQSVAFLITGLAPVGLIKWHSIIFSVLVVLTAYILLRKLILDKKKVYFATVFLVTGSVWAFPTHFSPNAFALVWYLLIFYFVFSRKTLRSIGLCIFLTIATIISHPTTLPFLLFSLVLISLGLTFSFKRNFIKNSMKKHWSLSQTFPVIVLTTWFAWLLFASTKQLTYLTRTAMHALMSLTEFLTFQRAIERFQTNPYHFTGQMLKISYSFLYVAMSIIGASYLIWKIRFKKKRENRHVLVTTMSWTIACGILGGIIAFALGGQLYNRPLLYGFIPLSILAAFTYDNKYTKIILISSMLIGAPLSILATYTNEYFEYSPITDSYGSLFMIEHGVTQQSNIEIGAPSDRVYRFYLFYWSFETGAKPEQLPTHMNTFFAWSQISENFYYFYLKGTMYWALEYEASKMSWLDSYLNLTNQPKFNLVYNNEAFHLGFVMSEENAK